MPHSSTISFVLSFARRPTGLFTKPPDGLPLCRTGPGGRSVWRFPIDIFPFCKERLVTKEPAALWIGLLNVFQYHPCFYVSLLCLHFIPINSGGSRISQTRMRRGVCPKGRGTNLLIWPFCLHLKNNWTETEALGMPWIRQWWSLFSLNIFSSDLFLCNVMSCCEIHCDLSVGKIITNGTLRLQVSMEVM